MHCNQDAITLAQYLDGELLPDQASALQEHIGECPRCAAVLCVDAASLLVKPEILCAGCDSSFSPEWGEAAAD